jgi:hypothetical protein
LRFLDYSKGLDFHQPDLVMRRVLQHVSIVVGSADGMKGHFKREAMLMVALPAFVALVAFIAVMIRANW